MSPGDGKAIHHSHVRTASYQFVRDASAYACTKHGIHEQSPPYHECIGVQLQNAIVHVSFNSSSKKTKHIR